MSRATMSAMNHCHGAAGPVLLVLCIILPLRLHAVDLDLGAGLQLSSTAQKTLSPWLGIRASHDSPMFSFAAHAELLRDGKYPSPEVQAGGSYFVMREGSASLHSDSLRVVRDSDSKIWGLARPGGRVEGQGFLIEGGRMDPSDHFDSPYSLFLSSQVHNPLTVRLAWQDPVFFYESRWIGLNTNSDIFRVDYPVHDTLGTVDRWVSQPLDRGANYKVYGMRFLDHWRLAYQETSIYTGRYFDPEFFLNPIPGYFVQYVNITDGTPWKQAKPWGAMDNGNYLMGFLLDWQDETRWLGMQFLLDDVNLNRFLAPSSFQNPDKLGLSLGWRESTEAGTFGAYAALVTKYTFSAIGTDQEDWYSMTYWPATRYPQSPGSLSSLWTGIDPLDNNLGYMNGENSLALAGDWSHTVEGMALQGRLEYRITGSQSPTNPWHEYASWTEGGSGPKWLGESRLEHKVTLKAWAELPLDAWTLFAHVDTGFVVNELELQAAEPGLTVPSGADRRFFDRYVPGTTGRLFGTIMTGLRYTLTW